MKSSLKALVAFAILSSAVGLDLGRLLGLRRDWRDLSSQPSIPQVVEVVRWRQPVCVVPGPGVPPCLVALRRHQVEYERNSAQGIEASRSVGPKDTAKVRKTGKNELEKAVWELGLGNEREIEKFCKEEYKNTRTGAAESRSIGNERVDVCRDWFEQWDDWSGRSQDVDLERPSVGADHEPGTSRKELVEQFCTHKFVNSEESSTKTAKHLAKIMIALRELGVLRKGDDASALDHICDSLVFAPKILSPQVVDSVHVESVDRVELDGSESSARSNVDHTVTLNLRSSTPGMEDARLRRHGRYLMIAGNAKANPTARSPPAIYVTKVLNSPVTATLVANNCFPDIGVPLCDEYQETLTIYKEPLCSGHGHQTQLQGSGSVSPSQGFPAVPPMTVDQVAESGDNGSHETVQENTESSDFWNDPSNPHFDDGTAVDEPQKPTGLLGQAVQHVLSKPGVIGAIPPGVIEAIANNPAIIEVLANGGQPAVPSGDSQINVTAIKPQVVTSTETSGNVAPPTTSKPGFISSFLDIQRPGILDKFWNPAFSIFNRSTTAKPEAAVVTDKPTGGHIAVGPVGQGHGPVLEAIQSIIHKPEVVSTNEKPAFQPVLVIEPPRKPGLFDNLWNPSGGFGLFDSHSTTTEKPATTEEPANVFTSAIGADEIVQPKPTQAPGLFGGLFGNPSGPTAANDGATGILGIGSSILSHLVDKPLIIERPGDKPLLVEKPIYIQEKPTGAAGLLNFFVPASSKPLLNVEHEVIKEPVYVYQKPHTASGILSSVFGAALSKPAFFQGWATFGKQPEKPTEKKETIDSTEEVSNPGGQNTRATFGESATTTTVQETRDPIVTASTEKVDEMEEAASFTDDESTEAIVTVQTPLKSLAPVEDIAEENFSETSVESTGPGIEVTPVVKAEKTTVDVAVSAPSVDVANLSTVENKVRDAEVAVEAEAILDNAEVNLVDSSEAAAQIAEHSEEESVIDNEA